MKDNPNATPVASVPPVVEPSEIPARLVAIKAVLGQSFLFHPRLPLPDMLRFNEQLLALHEAGTLGRESKAAILAITEEANKVIALREAPSKWPRSIVLPPAASIVGLLALAA